MSLRIGIVGLPNAGKSTVFNALTRAHAVVASYPFTTIEPNIGVAVVPDPRLDRIAAIIGPQSVVPASVEFVDIAGLVKGASQGEGLGNQFLGQIRTVDAILLVVRCFEEPDVPHVAGELDPLRDIQILDTELVLADLATVQRHLEKLRRESKGNPKETEAAVALDERLTAHLDRARLASDIALSEKEEPLLQDLNLLTAKPRLFLANVSESDAANGDLGRAVAEYALHHGSEAVALCAALEAELATWPVDEATAYRAELGLSESGLEALARAAYRLLALVTFFTTTGGREVRAWPIPRGTPALEAAGRIHSDMQLGFIRAEVVSYGDLTGAGSIAEARNRGLLRLEGRDYVVQDGDIIHVRFAV